MPTLNWIGKEVVVKHHKEVPFRPLEPVPELSCDKVGAGDDSKVVQSKASSGNLIVQGDNLHALKALLPRYSRQVKCIYIDPPYNTGQDDCGADGQRTGRIYNDRVESPEILEWLGKVVGIEAEDLCRHDKWLCMMYPRLRLLKDFLHDDGVIFASIDDIEVASVRLLFDEIFGVTNRIGVIVWKNATDNNPTQIASEHEYVLCYAKDKRKVPSEWKASTLEIKDRLLEVGENFVNQYSDQSKRQAAYTKKWYRENKAQLWPFEDYEFIDGGGVRTELAFGMLARFRPSGVMELTATPDLERTPGNVLHSVSAAELKAEERIKLPVVLETESNWQQCLVDAIGRRDALHMPVRDGQGQAGGLD